MIKRVKPDFRVANLSLSKQGRMDITLAENDMPGLLALRKYYGKKQPLKGARIAGSLHLTAQTAVLIETLEYLGAKTRFAASNRFSTQNAVAAALAKANFSVFGWEEETEEEYWWCIEQTLLSSEWKPNLLIDDGSDLTHFAHKNTPHLLKNIRGVSEETTTGITRLNILNRKKRLKIPCIDVNHSVTKSKFDNRYGCRESLIDGLKRATDNMIAGKKAVIIGFGDVGKGCAQSLHALGAVVHIVEVDPICALQAAMEGFRVLTLEEAATFGDLFITATGNTNVVTLAHMLKMKDNAILCNIGHFDSEIAVSSLARFKSEPLKPHVERISLPNRRSIILLAKGRLVNLVCAKGHPSFVMSMSFTNQVLAQIELWKHSKRYPIGIHPLPKILDETVARLHLEKLGIKLSKLTKQQARYLDVPQNGPFKSDYYRY